MTIQRVAVIGLGVIGASWAARFLRAGLQVHCFDPGGGTTDRLDDFLRDALGSDDAAHGWRARLHRCSSLEEAVQSAQWVQENGPEGLAAKHALIAKLDANTAASAVIASSTSGHQPSALQAMASRHPERVLVAHPLNPPHLIPLLELVPGAQTRADLQVRAVRLYERIGMRVVVPRQEKVGHVANRLQAALLREAFALAIEGVLDVPDIDTVVTHGLGLRWACAGPFALTELGGGAGGSRHMLTHLGPSLNGWWRDLSTHELDTARIESLADQLAQHRPRACSPKEAEDIAQAMRGYRDFCARQLGASAAGQEASAPSGTRRRGFAAGPLR